MFAAFAASTAAAAAVAFAIVAFFVMMSPEMCLDALVLAFHPNVSANTSDHVIHMINVDIATMMFTALPTLFLVDTLLSHRKQYLAKMLFIVFWVTSLFILEEMFFVELLRSDVFVAVLVLFAMYLLAFLKVPTIIKIVTRLILRIVGLFLRTFSAVTLLLVKCLIKWIMTPLILQMLAKDCLRVMSNCNIPTLGFICMYVSPILCYGIGLLLQLAYRLFNTFTDAVVAYGDTTLPLPTEDPDYTAGLPEAPPSVRWLCAPSVHLIPNDCKGRGGWPAIRAREDDNYAMYWNAQDALRVLIRVYNSFKRHHPHRFRSNSNYEKMLKECKLYELGIDMVMLEMKLRGEFRCTPLLRKAKRNWEEAGFDHADMIEEAAAEPVREEADAMPQFQDLVEEEIVFDQVDADEELGGDEEDDHPPKQSRRRRRNDVSCLESQLGRYWDAPRSTRSRREPKRYGCSD